jgi:S-adenosylmethionine decarboxylase
MNGIEWIVEAHGCTPASLADLPLLRSLFERIISELNLRPVAETQWHQFPQTGGITGLCLLAESHLACHTFPEFNSLCLNLFCCVPRVEWDFEDALEKMFSASSVTIRSLVRPYITSPTAEEFSRAGASDLAAGSRLG